MKLFNRINRMSERNVAVGQTVLRTVCMATIVAIVMVVTTGTRADAAVGDTPKVKIKRTAVVDEKGDAQFKLEIKMTTQMYTVTKANNPNTAVLLRRLGAGRHWAEIDDVNGRFDDNTSTVIIEYCHRGAARPGRGDAWEVPFEKADDVDLVGIFGLTEVRFRRQRAQRQCQSFSDQRVVVCDEYVHCSAIPPCSAGCKWVIQA